VFVWQSSGTVLVCLDKRNSGPLVFHGVDDKDFKAELLSNFVDISVGNTVRFRLAQAILQSGRVAQYYSLFRAISLEAVTYPVTRPEACAAFRAGLDLTKIVLVYKPQILELLMKDASVRHEMINVEVW
jgi:hypothetical protein